MARILQSISFVLIRVPSLVMKGVHRTVVGLRGGPFAPMREWIYQFLGIALLLVIAVPAFLTWRAPSEPDAPRTSALNGLSVDDCLLDARLSTNDRVRVGSCARPHAAQVIGTFDLRGDDFPGADALAAQSRERCVRFLSAAMSDAVGRGEVKVAWLTPSKARWDAGTHRGACLLATTGAPLAREVSS